MSVRAIEAEVSIKSGVQAECTIGREVIVEVHEDVNLESLTVTANGTYEPSEGVDGFSDVTVQVPERIPVTESLTVTENGTYEPDTGIDGYDRVVVDVPPYIPDIEPLTATVNGTYTAEGDGYNPVVVNVPPTIPDISPLTVTEDGVYQSSGDGYNPVTVNTGVDALRQEIASAETASGCSPLTEGLTALTTYANEVTGQEDETLSDAVETLASGYGVGANIAQGTFTCEDINDVQTIDIDYDGTGYPLIIYLCGTEYQATPINSTIHSFIAMKELPYDACTYTGGNHDNYGLSSMYYNGQALTRASNNAKVTAQDLPRTSLGACVRMSDNKTLKIKVTPSGASIAFAKNTEYKYMIIYA